MTISKHNHVNNIWFKLDSAIHARKNRDPLDVWKVAEEHHNMAKYRPKTIDHAELVEISSRHEETSYMLHNIENDRYIAFGEKELFLWYKMDGQHNVKDLFVELTMEYGLVGQTVVLSFIRMLKDNGFLQKKPTSVFQAISSDILSHSIFYQLKRVVNYLLHVRLTTKKADAFFERLYGRVSFVFSRPALVIIAGLLALDLFLASYLLFIKHETLLIRPETGAGSHDVIIMMLVAYISVFIHELAHGLTVKHYGRKVLRAGFMLVFGNPIAYVDTTDIWMKGHSARIGVSFAGPCINGVIGAVLLLKAIILPEHVYQNLMVHAGILNSLLFVINLVPFMETDGHYIIQDWFEQPRLRKDSLEFVRKGMWKKFRGHEKWDKADFGHLIYGTIALAGLGYMIAAGIHLWMHTGRHLLDAALRRPFMVVEVLTFTVIMVLLIALFRIRHPANRGRKSHFTDVLQARLNG